MRRYPELNRIIEKYTPLLVLAVFLGASILRVFLVLSHEELKVKDDTVVFWTESALHYRYAKLIAFQGGLDCVDEDAQYPEGLDVQRRMTVLMEIVAGYVYRFFIPRSVPFILFLVIFISLYSSSSVIPLYLLSNVIWGNKWYSLLIALLYATTVSSCLTVVRAGYELQDFALPLIFFHLYFWVLSARKETPGTLGYAFLSGAFLFCALVSWHLTQFYLVIFVVFVMVDAILLGRQGYLYPFLLTTGLNVLAGIVVPTLRSTGFLLSLGMLLSYSFIVYSVLGEMGNRYKNLVFGALIVISLLVSYYISSVKLPEYRFVYGLLLEKLRCLGARPSNSESLPWEILVMWVSPFTSPSLGTIFRSLGVLSVGGVVAIFMIMYSLVKNKNKRGDEIVPLFFFSVFFPLYLLLIRMDAFLVWFSALAVGKILSAKHKFVYLGTLMALFLNIFLLFTTPQRMAGPNRTYLSDVIRYIRHNTPRSASVLTSFPYGPSVLAYAQRPILLHPKFEATGITDKIKEFEHSLFQDEDTFYSFCRRYKARYFLYQADMLLARGTESIRYRTHNLNVKRSCTAFKFHFRPYELRHFELVYSNPHYRVYRILQENESPKRFTTPYFRIYDEQLFNLSDFGVGD